MYSNNYIMNGFNINFMNCTNLYCHDNNCSKINWPIPCLSTFLDDEMFIVKKKLAVQLESLLIKHVSIPNSITNTCVCVFPGHYKE